MSARDIAQEKVLRRGILEHQAPDCLAFPRPAAAFSATPQQRVCRVSRFSADQTAGSRAPRNCCFPDLLFYLEIPFPTTLRERGFEVYHDSALSAGGYAAILAAPVYTLLLNLLLLGDPFRRAGVFHANGAHE